MQMDSTGQGSPFHWATVDGNCQCSSLTLLFCASQFRDAKIIDDVGFRSHAAAGALVCM